MQKDYKMIELHFFKVYIKERIKTGQERRAGCFLRQACVNGYDERREADVDGCDEMTVDLQGNRDLLSQKLRILYDMI
jgi:hypothetical protein